jgi:molybdopterin synthase catalytic subunit
MDVRLQTEAFDPGALLSGFCQGRLETGAVVSFTGLVRGEAGAAEALELDAYPGFTEAEITRMVLSASDRFALQDALVVHRYGVMAPGEPIVFVATAAAHRRAAFEAADLLMDYLKSRAPFWKRARGAGGDHWIEPTPQDYADAARWDAPAEERS